MYLKMLKNLRLHLPLPELQPIMLFSSIRFLPELGSLPGWPQRQENAHGKTHNQQPEPPFIRMREFCSGGSTIVLTLLSNLVMTKLMKSFHKHRGNNWYHLPLSNHIWQNTCLQGSTYTHLSFNISVKFNLFWAYSFEQSLKQILSIKFII